MQSQKIEMEPWFDDCLLANSADVITQLQYSIVSDRISGESYDIIAEHHGISTKEVGHQLVLLREALNMSYEMLRHGDKEHVYDCKHF